MEKYFYKSPTRVDLAGGTLDMWPLYNFVGGATTINVAIDIWTSCEITSRQDESIVINSPDLNKKWTFLNCHELINSSDESVFFYKCIFKSFEFEFNKISKGFEIITTSQSPIGGGLGGSSSLVISILKSLYSFLKIKIPSVNELVSLAHNIEAQMLKTPTGTQDYFPAVTGGLSFIEYNNYGSNQKILSIKNTPLEDHFLLVYTGKSHHSGLNNFEVLKSAVQGDLKVTKALQKIKNIAEDLKKSILQNDWSKVPELFQQEFAARIELTPAFTSPEIEKLNRICLAAGAMAVKICGAGGGGCVLVWVSPDRRAKVVEICTSNGFKCLETRAIEAINL